MITISYYGQLKELIKKPNDLYEFDIKEKLTIENIRNIIALINKDNLLINKIEMILQRSMIAINDEYIREEDEIDPNDLTKIEISVIPPISGG